MKLSSRSALQIFVLLAIIALATVGSPAIAASNFRETSTFPNNVKFAGATRYETGLILASNYMQIARERNMPSDTIIIASGENLIDGAAASGLSKGINAPILLTPSRKLFLPAAHLIESEGISRIIIIGGTEAVSQEVEETLNGILGVSSVERIGGSNRFHTAALIAEAANSVGIGREYCEHYVKAPDSLSAILISGEDGLLADIISAGPLSYAMSLPILLTSMQGLPLETIEVIKKLGINRIVLIGGEYSVGDVSVLKRELNTAGISVITSLQGIDHFTTSVEVLEELKRCLGAEFENSSVALVGDTALADGISAAAVLGQGIEVNKKTVPILLVDSEHLPSSIEKYLLGANPQEIITIGGYEAIPADVIFSGLFAADGKKYEPTAGVNAYTQSNSNACRISSPSPYKGRFVSGFEVVGLRTYRQVPQPTGELKVAVLFVDFQDAQAAYSTRRESRGQLKNIEQYIEESSYHQLDIVQDVYHHWLRAPFTYKHYDSKVFPSGIHELSGDVVREAIREFDFYPHDYDNIMIVTPSSDFHGGAALYDSIRNRIGGFFYPIPISIINSRKLKDSTDHPREWWRTGAHEMMHGIGLADLYSYDIHWHGAAAPAAVNGGDTSFARFGNMGLQAFFPYVSTGDFSALEMLAWNRYLLDWLQERDVACLEEHTFNQTFMLHPIADHNPMVLQAGPSMIVVPTGSSNGIVIEARQKVGYDTDLPYGGVIAYEVDTSIHTGHLPIKLWPFDAGNTLLQRSLPIIAPGSSASGILVDGTKLVIEVVAEGNSSYVVNITRSEG